MTNKNTYEKVLERELLRNKMAIHFEDDKGGCEICIKKGYNKAIKDVEKIIDDEERLIQVRLKKKLRELKEKNNGHISNNERN